MPGETVRIRELVLRVPGLSEAEARDLSGEVARRVADALPPSGREEQLGSLDLRLVIPYGTPREQLARKIAAVILERLR